MITGARIRRTCDHDCVLILGTSRKANRSEQRMLDALAALGTGIVLANAMIPPMPDSGRRGRETDAVVICAGGCVCLEVKGTAQQGLLVPMLNDDWTIGGEAANFHGGANPVQQARVPAQMLAGIARHHGLEVGFVRAAVLVVARIEPILEDVGGVIAVSDLTRLGELVATPQASTLTRESILGLMRVLEFSSDDPNIEEELGRITADPPAADELARSDNHPSSDDHGDRAWQITPIAKPVVDRTRAVGPGSERRMIRDTQDGCFVTDLGDGTYLIVSPNNERSVRVRAAQYRDDARPLHWLASGG